MGETAHGRGGLHDESTRLLEVSGGSLLYDCEDGTYIVYDSP